MFRDRAVLERKPCRVHGADQYYQCILIVVILYLLAVAGLRGDWLGPLRDIEQAALPYLLKVAVKGQLLLVAGLHFGSIPNDPDGFLEAVLERFGRHGCDFM